MESMSNHCVLRLRCVELLDRGDINPRRALDDNALHYLSDKFSEMFNLTLPKQTLINKWNAMKRLCDTYIEYAIHSSSYLP
jgi:hypothetical protein